jgi:hypothetical protein
VSSIPYDSYPLATQKVREISSPSFEIAISLPAVPYDPIVGNTNPLPLLRPACTCGYQESGAFVLECPACRAYWQAHFRQGNMRPHALREVV